MATIKITTLKCIRKQDMSGDDEPKIYLGSLFAWDGKIGKGESLHPNCTRGFSDNILVELKEVNGNREKQLGKWTVSDTPTPVGNAPLTATSSGFHYEVYYDVY